MSVERLMGVNSVLCHLPCFFATTGGQGRFPQGNQRLLTVKLSVGLLMLPGDCQPVESAGGEPDMSTQTCALSIISAVCVTLYCKSTSAWDSVCFSFAREIRKYCFGSRSNLKLFVAIRLTVHTVYSTYCMSPFSQHAIT